MREEIGNIIRKPQMMYHPQIGLNFATISKEGAETIAQEILAMQCARVEKLKQDTQYSWDGNPIQGDRQVGFEDCHREVLKLFSEAPGE